MCVCILRVMFVFRCVKSISRACTCMSLACVPLLWPWGGFGQGSDFGGLGGMYSKPLPDCVDGRWPPRGSQAGDPAVLFIYPCMLEFMNVWKCRCVHAGAKNAHLYMWFRHSHACTCSCACWLEMLDARKRVACGWVGMTPPSSFLQVFGFGA